MSNASFPRAARLLKTDEFSSVFVFGPRKPEGARRPLRSTHFVMYLRDNALGRARLGLVIGKKQARRAAERNLVKRTAREAFRQCHAGLGGVDIVVRLQTGFGRDAWPSRRAVRAACREQLRQMFARVARDTGCRQTTGMPPPGNTEAAGGVRSPGGAAPTDRMT